MKKSSWSWNLNTFLIFFFLHFIGKLSCSNSIFWLFLQTGRAIKFAVDHVFSASQRVSQVKNRIAVVVTDGKSQDDVVNAVLPPFMETLNDLENYLKWLSSSFLHFLPQVDASTEARAQGITVFAVGVGSEITTSELISIANVPSSTYVLYAQDYTNIDRIQDSMEQKLCEGQQIKLFEVHCCISSMLLVFLIFRFVRVKGIFSSSIKISV